MEESGQFCHDTTKILQTSKVIDKDKEKKFCIFLLSVKA